FSVTIKTRLLSNIRRVNSEDVIFFMQQDRLQRQAAEIKEILKRTRLHPFELARMIYVDPETFRKAENGYQRLGAARMELMRKIAAELAGPAGEGRVREPSEEFWHDFERELALVKRNATDEDRYYLRTVMDAVYKRNLERLGEQSPSESQTMRDVKAGGSVTQEQRVTYSKMEKGKKKKKK